MTLPVVAAGQSTFGIRGGLSIASFGGDDAGDPASRKGFSIGGFFNVPLSGTIGVEVGAGFVQKGATETELGVETELAINYIEIPLLLTLSPPTTGNVGFNFFVGPALSFKTSCDASVSEDGVTVNFACAVADLPLKSFDLGAMVGAGLEFGLTESASLVFDLFYNLGLTKIDNSGVDDDTKNRAFSILAGVSFPVGG